jgi:hypothetical protein
MSPIILRVGLDAGADRGRGGDEDRDHDQLGVMVEPIAVSACAHRSA